MLLVPGKPFRFMASRAPPPTAATISASTAHLIQDLLPWEGSGGNAGPAALPEPIGDRNGATGSDAVRVGWGAGVGAAAAGALVETKGSMTGAVVVAVAAMGVGAGVAAIEGSAMLAGLKGSITGCATGVATTGAAATVATAAIAATGAGAGGSRGAASAGNEVPHLGQKRACGLHRCWHCSQTWPAASAAGEGIGTGAATGSGACLAPQFLQNLALGARGFPHCEQFIVGNGLVMLLAMSSLSMGYQSVLYIEYAE